MLAARVTRGFVRDFEPDVAVSDILTPAPALAAELEGVPVATLVPHVHPDLPPGFPPFSIGARLPRTRVGARLWRHADRAVQVGLEQGRQRVQRLPRAARAGSAAVDAHRALARR